MEPCFQIVAVRVDEERAIEGLAPDAGVAIVPGTQPEPCGMEPIHTVLRRRAEGEMQRALPGFVPVSPETRPAGCDHEERRVRRAGAEDEPTGTIGLHIILQK